MDPILNAVNVCSTKSTNKLRHFKIFLLFILFKSLRTSDSLHWSQSGDHVRHKHIVLHHCESVWNGTCFTTEFHFTLNKRTFIYLRFCIASKVLKLNKFIIVIILTGAIRFFRPLMVCFSFCFRGYVWVRWHWRSVL